MIDPRMYGTLVEIERSGYETADPHLDAEAVARGLAYRTPGDGMDLTREGKRALRARLSAGKCDQRHTRT